MFIVHESCNLRIPAENVVYTNCCPCFVLTFRTIFVHNMFCRCYKLLKNSYLYWQNGFDSSANSEKFFISWLKGKTFLKVA